MDQSSMKSATSSSIVRQWRTGLPTARFLLWTLLLSGGACGGDAQGPVDVDYGGRWRVSERVTGRTLPMECADAGTLVLFQSDRTLTGQYEMDGWCDLGEHTFQNPRGGPVESGSVEGRRLLFRHGPCAYRADFAPGRSDIIGGQLVCRMRIAGEMHGFGGNWTAARDTSPASGRGGKSGPLMPQPSR